MAMGIDIAHFPTKACATSNVTVKAIILQVIVFANDRCLVSAITFETFNSDRFKQ
jgi:hypothetical protein